jgi:hypothetical protein
MSQESSFLNSEKRFFFILCGVCKYQTSINISYFHYTAQILDDKSKCLLRKFAKIELLLSSMPNYRLPDKEYDGL